MSLFEIDKEKAMQRYRRFKQITSFATTLQFRFAFLLFSWLISQSSAYFPAAVELFRFILRRLCTLAVNHHFGFLLGNLIIITLFLKSGHFACQNRRSSAIAENDDDGFLIRQFVPPNTEDKSPVESEELAVQRVESEPRKYRRTRSEEFEPEVKEKIQLSRSETEPRREMRRRMEQVEDLSNEEFQRKVEAFIERQQRFLREESLSTALRNRCTEQCTCKFEI